MKFNITAMGSTVFWQPQKLLNIFDKELEQFLASYKDAALREIDHNLSKMSFPYGTGRLRNSMRATVDKSGKKVRIWNPVRNNTSNGVQHRYAQYVEEGRRAFEAKGPTPLTWFHKGWVTQRSVRKVAPRPFFFKGAEKALNKELSIFGEDIGKTFDNINSRLTTRKF